MPVREYSLRALQHITAMHYGRLHFGDKQWGRSRAGFDKRIELCQRHIRLRKVHIQGGWFAHHSLFDTIIKQAVAVDYYPQTCIALAARMLHGHLLVPRLSILLAVLPRR